jgi:sulfur carrier protein ThiS
VRVAPGTLVRAALRSVGHSPEGCAVLVGEVPIPLDTPIDRPMRLTVVPTFSGG